MSRRTSCRRLMIVPLWTRILAQRALPYLACVLRSLRESQLEANQHQRTLHRSEAGQNRSGRASLRAHDEAVRAAELAHARVREAIEELRLLGIVCSDPIAGQALLPFAHGTRLAWLIYDLFDEPPIRSWRYHTDPLETRRPIHELPKEA